MEFTLEKLEVYNIAEKFSDDIWDIVVKWDYFKKDTIGKQLVRAADSSQLILQKVMDAIFIRRVNNFIFIRPAPFRKQNPGSQNV